MSNYVFHHTNLQNWVINNINNNKNITTRVYFLKQNIRICKHISRCYSHNVSIKEIEIFFLYEISKLDRNMKKSNINSEGITIRIFSYPIINIFILCSIIVISYKRKIIFFSLCKRNNWNSRSLSTQRYRILYNGYCIHIYIYIYIYSGLPPLQIPQRLTNLVVMTVPFLCCDSNQTKPLSRYLAMTLHCKIILRLNTNMEC